MRRRAFIAGLGAAAALPAAGRVQPAFPTIGYLTTNLSDSSRHLVSAFERGLSEAGYVVGRDVTIEYRSADLHLERLPALADDLARRRLAAIVATPTSAVFAAMAATKTIPIVFNVGIDPVEAGIVASLRRPDGNLTGVSMLFSLVVGKRLELLHELVPAAASIGYLVDPTSPATADTETKELEVAARVLGVQLQTVAAKEESEFEAAFTALAHERVGGLVIGSYTLFFNRYDRLIELAARYQMPTVYQSREAVAAGGLIAYGTDLTAVHHELGVYAGRILKGEKPTNLPVQQVTKMQLAINMKTAKALGLTFPLTLLGRADEVIE